MIDQQKNFPAIYAEYRPKIVGYLRRLVGDADAEDVTQEVFVKVSRSLDNFRGDSSLSTWIYRIATNAATDHLRKPSSRKALPAAGGPPDDEAPADDSEALDDGMPVLDTLLIRKDMNECIRGVVDSLPENHRTVLVLGEIEGLTNAEIAEVLGISMNTVKVRLHRARVRLRKALEAKCSFYHDTRNELACDRKTILLRFPAK